MAAVGMADRGINLYTLDSKPAEYKRIESPLKVTLLNSEHSLLHYLS